MFNFTFHFWPLMSLIFVEIRKYYFSVNNLDENKKGKQKNEAGIAFLATLFL